MDSEPARFYFSSTDSTNLCAARFAAEHPGVPAVFVAERQTAGRGRLGHSFASPPGGLYISYLLYPDMPPADSGGLTIYTATVLSDILEDMTGTPVGIKWVNDLYMNGKKIAGILAEGAISGDGTLAHAVIGIGINLRHTDFPPDIAAVASTVEDESGTVPERSALERRLTAAMITFRPRLPGIIDAYRRRMFLTGMTVTVEKGGETFDAEVLGVTDEGALLIRTRDGNTIPLSSGDVHVHPFKNKSV